MTKYVEDLFSTGIDPGISEGLKLYLKLIADRTTKEEIISSNVKTVMLMLKSDAQDFSWDELVHRVANDDTNANFSSILKNYSKLTVVDLQKHAHGTFCDKISTYSTVLPVDFT